MLPSLRPAWIVARRELRDQLRDWRIIAPIIVLTVIFPSLMNFTARRAVLFVSEFGAEIVGERLIPFLLMVVGFFPITVSLVIALESFVGEKERGSIEPLLASPLKDWHLYLGKLVAVMVPPLIASYLGIGVYLYGVYRDVGWVAPSGLLIQILSLVFVQALVMVSGAVVISTQTTSVRAANLLSSFIIIPMAFLIQGESIVMFWGQYNALWWAVFGLVIIAGLLLRTGVTHFNREELLGRELDVLNLRWMLRVFRGEFLGEAKGILSWYRLEVMRSLRELRLPSLLMVVFLVGSLFVGFHLAGVFVIPPELVKLDNLRTNLFEGFDNLTLFSTSGIPLIWFQNVRAILLATFLGLFTYAVLGTLVLMLPMVVIGYFMATLATAGFPMTDFFIGFVLPHGVFEIPAIILAGAAILRMGASLAGAAHGRTVGEGLLRSWADWTKIMVGVVMPLLLLAAVVEVHLTPQIAQWIVAR